MTSFSIVVKYKLIEYLDKYKYSHVLDKINSYKYNNIFINYLKKLKLLYTIYLYIYVAPVAQNNGTQGFMRLFRYLIDIRENKDLTGRYKNSTQNKARKVLRDK